MNPFRTHRVFVIGIITAGLVAAIASIDTGPSPIKSPASLGYRMLQDPRNAGITYFTTRADLTLENIPLTMGDAEKWAGIVIKKANAGNAEIDDEQFHPENCLKVGNDWYFGDAEMIEHIKERL